jgi:hypothetical protein
MKLSLVATPPRRRAVRTAALLATSAVIGLAGCADAPSHSAQLTYETVPAGALLYEAGHSLGMAPVTRSYTGDGKSATITTPDVTAVWPSGAKTQFFTYLQVGADRVATLQRPKDAPGLQADLDHARTIAETRKRATEREKASLLNDIARDSARCKAQQSGATPNTGTDNCAGN